MNSSTSVYSNGYNKRQHLLLHQFVDLFFCSSYKSCHTDPNRVSHTSLCETDNVSSFLLLRQPPASLAVFVQIVSCLHTYTIFFRVCKWGGGGECLNLQLPQRINTAMQLHHCKNSSKLTMEMFLLVIPVSIIVHGSQMFTLGVWAVERIWARDFIVLVVPRIMKYVSRGDKVQLWGFFFHEI